MIKAVVVDDERLVRKGFISLVDWASFGVVITGEAGDGKAALELLGRQEIDLLFTDLIMPGMSGFELIREVRGRYPHISCAVLTCHHEFDYVQEALRLGAVDYIVKTLLEADNAAVTIRRLVERVRLGGGQSGAPAGGERERMTADLAMLYVPHRPELREEQVYRQSPVQTAPLLALQDMWLAPLQGGCDAADITTALTDRLGPGWTTALLAGLRGQPLPEIGAVLGQTVRQVLFYDSGSGVLPRLVYGELRALAGQPRLAPANAGVLAAAQDLRWTLEQREWELFTGAVLSQQPRPEAVAAFGLELLHCWSGLLLKPEEALQLEKTAGSNQSWVDWSGWLRRFSDHVQRRTLELGLSREVMFCLFRAVRYMRSHAGEKINQGQVAAAVHLSRGYFSRCFARFAGQSFGDSLRTMRLAQAKSLLLHTHVPLGEIACMSGFEDERYFRRLFRMHTGKLPSEYRAEGMRST
ncbi:response regulator transcription factor [Paenibacillus piscarius]|uniref:response regulator transcription factor n=1 Tax=Paenibacillus piscarius TaxID=1089681 RepID=UPI001EE91811|nr:response regulator [Paenibacillus piscarius]